MVDTTKLSKADADYVRERELAAMALVNSGKPPKIVGLIRKLPLSEIDAKHFKEHKAEFVWRADPVEGVHENINGLYAGMWLTDKYDHIPMVFVSEEVLYSILKIKRD